MIDFNEVKKQQSQNIESCFRQTQRFIQQHIESNTKIISCLLSGSLARGDYWPGKNGGAIDLMLFVRDTNSFDAALHLGPDIDPHIPGHFIMTDGIYYQIKICDQDYIENFAGKPEPEKFAFLESKILFDKSSQLQKQIKRIKDTILRKQIENNYESALRYARYLINDYKTDRWKRRDATAQLHQNLNRAIEQGIKALYYLNGKYCPAEDRMIYYSYNLDKKPDLYVELIDELMLIPSLSMEAYLAREEYFKEKFLSFLDAQNANDLL